MYDGGMHRLISEGAGCELHGDVFRVKEVQGNSLPETCAPSRELDERIDTTSNLSDLCKN